MKATVLVIGQNVERQVVDFKEQDVIYDENHRAWLNFRFDNQSLVATAARRRFSELGILKRALQLLDYNVTLPEKAQQFAIRVLLRANDQYKAIRIGECDDGLWQRPEIAPETLVLLESAQLSEVALTDINRYLDQFPRVKLVVEYRSELQQSSAGRQLLLRAQLVWADLISYQTGETEGLLNQFKFNQQMLLINHHTGLSLSDSQRTYKLTNADYLELKSLEWLAIAIKIMAYQFDIEDKLELIARIGQSIVRTNQAKVQQNLTKLTHQDPAIELIRGEPDLAKRLTGKIRQMRQSSLISLDLSGQKFTIAKQLLQVRDLPATTKLVSLSYQQHLNLAKRHLPLLGQLQEQLNLVVDLETKAHNLAGCGREVYNRLIDLDERLNQLQFQQVAMVKAGADFLFDRSLPSDRIILANGRELAELASRALSRGMIPVLEIRAVAQANFDARPGSVALDYLRILRSLEVELRARQVNPDQVLIWLRLPTGQGQKNDLSQIKAWTEAILQQIRQYRLGFTMVGFVADVDWFEYKALRASQLDMILTGVSYQFLAGVAMIDSQLRVKFSQMLAETT